MIEVTWAEFKQLLGTSIGWVYVQADDLSYSLYVSYNGLIVKCYLIPNSADITEFEANYKSLGNRPIEVDSDGRQVTRLAATNKGWHYQAYFFEIETATGTCHNHDRNGNNLNEIVVHRYDSNNQITNVTENTVKTVVTMKRAIDFEIVSGRISQINPASSDIRMWVTAGVYNELNNYSEISVVSFVEGGMNLRYFEESETDGRASKYIKYNTVGVPFPTNRFQYIIKHDAGVTHKIQIRMDLYKA
jgi:hypothetical protein